MQARILEKVRAQHNARVPAQSSVLVSPATDQRGRGVSQNTGNGEEYSGSSYDSEEESEEESRE